MSEMEVIRLQTGCKGEAWWACRRKGFFGRGARLLKTLGTQPGFNVFRYRRSVLGQNACRAAALVWQIEASNLLQTNGSATSQRSHVAASFEPAASRKPICLFGSLVPPKISLDPLAHFPETLKVLGVSISREQGGGIRRYRLGSTKRDSIATVWSVGCCRTDRIYA